jgi:hypothetical protein
MARKRNCFSRGSRRSAFWRRAFLSFALVTSVSVPALAEESLFSSTRELSFALPAAVPPLRLVGGFGGGGGAIARAPSGLFIGADTGWAVMLGPRESSAPNAWAFGARVGYEWQNGLALEGRFDDLGVHPPTGGGSLLFGSAGIRYSLPLVVMPFAEALVGPGFNGSHLAPGAGLGVGASLPVLRHLMFDLALRDWIIDLDGGVRNVPTVELGITVGFGGR